MSKKTPNESDPPPDPVRAAEFESYIRQEIRQRVAETNERITRETGKLRALLVRSAILVVIVLGMIVIGLMTGLAVWTSGKIKGIQQSQQKAIELEIKSAQVLDEAQRSAATLAEDAQRFDELNSAAKRTSDNAADLLKQAQGLGQMNEAKFGPINVSIEKINNTLKDIPTRTEFNNLRTGFEQNSKNLKSLATNMGNLAHSLVSFDPNAREAALKDVDATVKNIQGQR